MWEFLTQKKLYCFFNCVSNNLMLFNSCIIKNSSLTFSAFKQTGPTYFFPEFISSLCNEAALNFNIVTNNSFNLHEQKFNKENTVLWQFGAERRISCRDLSNQWWRHSQSPYNMGRLFNNNVVIGNWNDFLIWCLFSQHLISSSRKKKIVVKFKPDKRQTHIQFRENEFISLLSL